MFVILFQASRKYETEAELRKKKEEEYETLEKQLQQEQADRLALHSNSTQTTDKIASLEQKVSIQFII